jgi:hypothetical protein
MWTGPDDGAINVAKTCGCSATERFRTDAHVVRLAARAQGIPEHVVVRLRIDRLAELSAGLWNWRTAPAVRPISSFGGMEPGVMPALQSLVEVPRPGIRRRDLHVAAGLDSGADERRAVALRMHRQSLGDLACVSCGTRWQSS